MADKILTYNGYDMFEVVSALQKAIRRGSEEDAMYWGVEMFISGFIPYAWKRLIIISMEDVGLANPWAPLVVKKYKEIYDEMTKDDKKNQFRLPYVQAILYLVHCQKSRHTDWAQGYWFDEVMWCGGQKKIPDYALDIHTRRGKMIGKTIEDFFNEGSLVNNHEVMPNEEFYRDKCHERWTSKEWAAHVERVKAQREAAQPNQPHQQELF